jgi:chemotaxis protein CheD
VLDKLDVFLQPGELYFGNKDTRIRTLLGSCVAVTWWHPQRQIGAMCHYLLPNRPKTQKNPSGKRDGRYAEEAFATLLDYISKERTQPSDYEVKIFGGGNMLMSAKITNAVGPRNVDYGKLWLANHGFTVRREHVAGDGHRNIIFDVESGDVWVRFQPQQTTQKTNSN